MVHGIFEAIEGANWGFFSCSKMIQVETVGS